jgi:hypothetical protein
MGRALIASVLVLPALVFAQSDAEALRAQIRADLMQDPRSSEMTSAEFDAMVEEIASEAESSGVAADYLESGSTFDYSSLFTPPEEPSALLQAVLSPLSLAVIFLLVVLFAVAYYIIHRGKTPEAPESD